MLLNPDARSADTCVDTDLCPGRWLRRRDGRVRSSTVSAQLARAVHVGRQPIHDVHGRLQAYELLFRNAEDAVCAQIEDADQATTSTILAAFSEFDAQDLLGGLPALGS